MSASETDIARLRSMVAEPDETTYDDSAIAAFIERYPVTDDQGYDIYLEELFDGPLTLNPLWTPTYDLNAAAADVWDEKASAIIGQVTFTADGATVDLNEKVRQHERRARHFRSRRRPGSARLVMTPDPKIASNNDGFVEAEERF